MSKMPVCPYDHLEVCFAKRQGIYCYALASTSFVDEEGKRKECPFYKSLQQLKEEEKKNQSR